jgi:fibronectin-binding autotransporter adhesin
MKSPLILAVGITSLLGAAAAHATTYYLDTATGSPSWSNFNIWTTDPANPDVNPSNGIPTIADLATFNDTALNTTAATVTLDAPQAALGIVVNTSGAVGLNAGGTANTLTLGSSGITVASVSTLTIGATTGTAEPMVLSTSQSWANNSSNSNSIVINSAVSGSTVAATTLTLAGAQNNTSGNNAINGVISDGAGPLKITMSGANNLRWYLNGTNLYTGVTTVSNGGLTIGNTAALGATGAASGTVVASGASVFFRVNVGTVAETLSIAGSGTTAGTGALRNVAGTNTWSGPITTTAASTIGADAGQLTISGDITSSTTLTFVQGNTSSTGTVVVQGNISGGSLTESQSAATGAAAFLTLSTNAKTYSGATAVTGGTLTLNTSLPSTSAVNVNSAGTLRGNGGSINTAALTSVNGTLSPGATAGAIGTLAMGALSLSLGAAATFVLDINTGVATPTHDTVSVTGNLTLGTTFNTALTVTDAGSVVLPVGTVIPFMTYTETYSGGLFYVGGTADHGQWEHLRRWREFVPD